MILIPPFSIMGAAVSTLLSYFIMFLVLYIYSQKVYYIQYEWNKLMPIIFGTTLLFFVSDYLISSNLAIQSNIYFVYFIKIIAVMILLYVIYKVKAFKILKTSKL